MNHLLRLSVVRMSRNVAFGALLLCATSLGLAQEPTSPVPAAAQGQAFDPTIPQEKLQGSLRDPVAGVWRPTILPPNDLTDPPRNYPHCYGGACVGMSSVVYALWCCPQQEATTSAGDAAARVIHNLVADRGRLDNPALPTHIILEGRRVPTTSPEALVRIAELVQLRFNPAARERDLPDDPRRTFQEVSSEPRRLTTPESVKQHIIRAGGRAVVGLIGFDRAFTKTDGHCVILSLGEDDKVYAWDPNAKMKPGAVGSSRLAPVELSADPQGRLQLLRYEVTLPDGSKSRRAFQFALPVTCFIKESNLPVRPASLR